MGLVVLHLDLPPPRRLVDGPSHRIRHLVGEHDHPAVDISRGPAAGLDQRGVGAQKPFLVGVEYGDEGDLGQIEPFPEKVDAHEDIELAETKVADDGDPLQGIDLGMEVFGLDPRVEKKIGQVLGKPLGQRGDEDPFLLAA